MPVRFAAFGSFPQVPFLRPEPAATLVALTASLAQRWPETPPYAGAFLEVVPHLTVAVGVDDVAATNIRADINKVLPIETVLREARLFAFTAGRWLAAETFALGRHAH